MSKSAAPRDGVTVVIPAHNAADALDKALPAWGAVLPNLHRPYEIVVVNDGSTDTTAEVLQKRAGLPRLRVLTHDARRGFGACLRTALAGATHPLLLYAGVDYPYTPSDIRPMLERIEVRDQIFGRQPDLISGFRAGQPRPTEVAWLFGAWKIFWRVFAGLPITDPAPWYGWDEWWSRTRLGWVFGVPLADVNSAFKLYRVSFLRRVPIQSDGDFVHTELVAKATFLTSIMDELPLTAKPDPIPPLGPTADDERTVFRSPEFAIYPPEPPAVEPPKAEAAATAVPAPAPAQPVAEPAAAAVPGAAAQPAAEARPEANAGGLGSPESPVPAP